MESLGSIFEIGKNMWEATAKWVGYFNNLDANMRNLKRKIEDLSCKEDDIITQLSSEQYRPGKRRKKEVEVWLRDVSKEKDEVQRLEQRVAAGETNFVSRTRLGKEVVEKIEELAELEQKGRFSDGLVIDAPLTRGRFIPTTAYFSETTSAGNMEKVWACLMDDEIRRIGVFGMGGVGKTTIMHHIHNRLLNETCDFDNVIWVTVSKAFDIRKIQHEIAKELDRDFSDYEDETRRASELYKMLSQKKRYVLILDDLWEAFPLEKVGILEPTRSNGCKLVLTTRLLEVCRKMECSTVKVELLTEEEALNLFMSTVEHQIVLASEVKEIATKVAEECACLPLAIIAVAGSMRGVNGIHEWRNALNELISKTEEIIDDESEVFERLKFSYSRLKDEKLQHCFLFCALYPEDHDIYREQLIGYWIAEGLIAEMNSREAMFDKGHTILTKLVDTCLLESRHWDSSVRMHDLIRDMALKITATSPRFMVRAGEGLERVPYGDWSEDLERVSLMYNKIQVLPSRPPICCQLTTLLLQDNDLLGDISDSFFVHMRCLKVLDLSRTNIKSLPESISNLENLHALLLDQCRQLEYVPSLEKLKALKDLKLGGSGIQEVPQGIEELVNLRDLDLSWTESLEMFPPLKLCRLTQLHCLRIEDSKLEVSAKELLCLRQLEVLHAPFDNVQELTTYVTTSQQCQRLKNYRLSVGISKNFPWIATLVKEVYVRESELFGSGVVDPLLVLPSNIECLTIERCHDLISLSDILSLRNARDLVTCHINDCHGIESIFSSLSSSSFLEEDSLSLQIPLRRLDCLVLYNLPNFQVLFDAVVVPPPGSISFNLGQLYLCGCPSIKNIFPAAMLLQNFPNLERLEVSGCEQVEDVIGGGEVEMMSSSNWGGHHHQDHGNIITLPNLRYLTLLDLPRLKSIYKGILVCESLEHIWVRKCPMLRRLPLSLNMDISEQASAAAPPALKYVTGERGWWESLEWDDPKMLSSLSFESVPDAKNS